MEEIKAFIQWLSKSGEFLGMNESQIVESLNKMSKTDEGKQEISKLMSSYKADRKIDRASQILKAAKGTIYDPKSQLTNTGENWDNTYNRWGAKHAKQFGDWKHVSHIPKTRIWHTETAVDDEGNEYQYQVRKSGDQNVLAKKAKAANVAGFDESMFNFDPDQKFDRQRYRLRKRWAKQFAPEFSRRQRKAWALMDDGVPTGTTEPPKVLKTPVQIDTSSANLKPIENDTKIQIPVWEDESVNISPLYHQVQVKRKFKPIKAVSFNQFAGLLDDAMRRDKSIVGGSDLRAFQVHRAKEYERYAADPENYKWQNMAGTVNTNDAAFLADENKYRNAGLLANRRGAGYYNPNDNSFASRVLFKNRTAKEILDDQASKLASETFWVDSTGRRLSDEEVAKLASNPATAQYFTTKNEHSTTPTGRGLQVSDATIGRVPESMFSDAMNDVAMGVAVGSGAMAAATTGAAQGAKDASKYIWDGTKWVLKQGQNYAKQAVQRARDTYSQQANNMAREYMRQHGGHGRFQPQAYNGQYTWQVKPGTNVMNGRQWIQTGGKPSFGHFNGGHAPYVPSSGLYLFDEGGKLK